MNKTQFKCLLVFSIFAIIGFGPISPSCLIGMVVVVIRPRWFWQLTLNLNDGTEIKPLNDITTELSQQARKKCFISLLALFIADIAPVPVTPVIAFIIIFMRPEWFYRLVTAIYKETAYIETTS